MIQKAIECIEFIHPLLLTAVSCVVVLLGIVYVIEKIEKP